MSEKHDGWAMQKEEWNNYIDPLSFRRTRTQCIQDFETAIRWSWRQAKKRGWRCIKVRLVPIAETAVSQETS